MKSLLDKRMDPNADPWGRAAASTWDPYRMTFGEGEISTSGNEKQEVLEDCLAVLGPLVHEQLRDEAGALNLKTLAAKKFEGFDSFKNFLAAQASLNDNKSFRNPYQSLLEGPRFERLLRYLYAELDPKQFTLLTPSGARQDLQELQAALIEIDAEAFARNFSGDREGRGRLSSLLAQDSPLSKDQRADLIKGIFQVGEEKNAVSPVDHFRVEGHISAWNYFNLGVSEQELAVASEGASSILRSMEFYANQAEKNQELFETNPGSHSRILVNGKLKEIPQEKLIHYQNLIRERSLETGAIAEAHTALAKLWLFAANERNFDNLGQSVLGLSHEKSRALQRRLLEKSEALIREADRMESREDFETFHEKLSEFLQKPWEAGALPWLKHQALGASFSDDLANMPQELRAPLDQLIHLMEQWQYSVLEMGEHLNLKPLELRAGDEEFRLQIAGLIRGLEGTKHGLWQGYKQHKAISRGISQTASLFNQGDTQDIRGAQITINSLIYQLSEADEVADLPKIYQELMTALEEDGSLFKALQAAEMDGTEHLLGLSQTIAEMAALAAATRGLSVVAEGASLAFKSGHTLKNLNTGIETAKTLRSLRQGTAAAEGLQLSEKMVRGFGMGAGLATMENLLAVSTGEVRQGPETVQKWFKDAISTGIAMGITAGVMPQFGRLPPGQQSLIQNLWLRYTTGGLKGLGHLAADTGLEVFEETLDQYLRQVLDGDVSALTEAEFQELALICMAGGGAKVGVLSEHVQAGKAPASVDASGARPPPGPLFTKEGELASPANDNAKPLGQRTSAAMATLGAGLAALLQPQSAHAAVDGAAAALQQGGFPALGLALGSLVVGAMFGRHRKKVADAEPPTEPNKSEELTLALNLTRQLAESGPDQGHDLVKRLENILSELEPEEAMALGRELLPQLEKKFASVRKQILGILTAIPSLLTEQREAWTQVVAGFLQDPSPHVRGGAVLLLNSLLIHLDLPVRFLISLKVLAALEDEVEDVRKAAVDFFAYVFRFLPLWERQDLSLKMAQILRRGGPDSQAFVLSRLWFNAFSLRSWEQRRVLCSCLEDILQKGNFPSAQFVTDLENLIHFLRVADPELDPKANFSSLGLKSIHFANGGPSVSSIPQVLDRLLDLPPRPSPLQISSGEAPFVSLQTSLREFLASQEATETGRNLGRSVVYPLLRGAKQLVLKYPREGQSGEDLLRELQWLDLLRGHPETKTKLRGVLKNRYPSLLRDPRGPLGLLKFHDAEKNSRQEAIAFQAHPEYYRYLDDPSLSGAQLMTGLTDAIHDVFTLARFGIYHTVPLNLFHNVEMSGRKDEGRYVLAPDWVFETEPMGMGRLHDWPGSLKHGNMGATGLRDLEELATFEEILSGVRPMPELKPLQNKPDPESKYEALITGNALLAATLYLGNRMAEESQDYSEALPFWKNSPWLQPYADQLLEIYATAYAARRELPVETAKELLQSRVDWLRLARQLAFFMTEAHVLYLQEGAKFEDFPQEIYGPRTILRGTVNNTASFKVMGPYRKGTFHEQRGFLGPDGDPQKLSLGPVNGPSPIQEFEKAWASTLF